VIAGDAGFAQRREYTVVGSPVAFAHRLSVATSDLNAYIVVARDTIDPVRELYDFVPVSGIPIAGQRALLDAVIIRGRKRSDELTLPRAGTFANTVLDEPAGVLPEPEPAAAAPAAAAPPPVATPVATPVAPPAPPPPPDFAPSGPPPAPAAPDVPLPLRTRPVARDGAERRGRGFDLPELRFPSGFDQDDEGPIMPEPPPPRQTYEDKGGPPLQL
jgi:hypothetical protein